MPGVRAEAPSRNWSTRQLGRNVHSPGAVTVAPRKYDPGAHTGRRMHVYPSIVPAHTPARYAPVGQVRLLHRVQLKRLVDPPHTPSR